MHLLRPHAQHSALTSGLTRVEWLWTVLLVGVILATILITLDAEVERGAERMNRDQMAYLASTIHLGLERAAIAGPEELSVTLPLLGPGVAPKTSDGQVQQGEALQSLMPKGFYLPTDPWGRSYVLMSAGPSVAPQLYLISAGADGVLPQDIDPHQDEVVQVFWSLNS